MVVPGGERSDHSETVNEIELRLIVIRYGESDVGIDHPQVAEVADSDIE